MPLPPMTVVDTIAALSTGNPPCAIAIIRVSGPGAGGAIAALTGAVPPPRHARRCILRDAGGTALDDGLALWFPAPHSATGEDVAEFHIHGGRAVIEAVLTALLARPGVRLAEAGEFTRRAFDNGRLSLAEVEGLADLLAAETEGQRRQALAQMQGAIGRQAETWRARIIALQARLEASIDFSDEGDVPDTVHETVGADAAALADEIAAVLADGGHGERLRDGFVVVLAGPPNAGKSTLLNVLAQREAAIVAPTPGTTRDVIEVRLDLGGLPVTLFDTAGLRDSSDPVEAEGIARARARASTADLVLWLSDDATPPPADLTRAWLVRTKIDRGPYSRPELSRFGVSAVTGDGVGDLTAAVIDHLRGGDPAEAALITRARHRAALEDARDGLRRAASAGADELAADDLQAATRAIGRLLGRSDVENILDVIFRDFCIGK